MKLGVIKNFDSLVENGESEKDRAARRSALAALERAVETADSYRSVASKISGGRELILGPETLDLERFERVFVVGAGKAGANMSKAVEDRVELELAGGVVNVPRGQHKSHQLRRIRLNPAGHPLPDEGSLRGAMEILDIVRRAGRRDLVITLISGGGSALMELPQKGISLEDLKRMNELLIKSGADIREINAVRKHVSRIKGGRLAEAAYPARLVSLIISDVVGDPLDSIASGPTSPDETTFQDAWDVLERYDLVGKMPESVIRVLKKGLRGEIPETPKPGDEIFDNVTNVIVANNLKAVEAAARFLEDLGYNVVVLGSRIQGEARHVGRLLANLAKSVKHDGHPISPPAAILAGGETTVHVVGDGVGGRNQELVLGGVRDLSGEEGVALASMGTDGIDGVSEAAGAVCDGRTLKRALDAGMRPEDYLIRNDSYTFFSWLNDAIITGQTGTNVMDVMAIVVEE